LATDDSSLLPKPPPPRPARRDAAIEAAMRRFDGVEEPKAVASRGPHRGFGGRPQFGALVTASLVVVIGLPAALIAIRNSQVPPPPPPKPAAMKPAPVPSADATPQQEVQPAPSEIQLPTTPPAVLPAPDRRRALSDTADEGTIQSTPVASYAPAPPPSVTPAAPPPPPPPPPEPVAGMAESEATTTNEQSVVVTGSRLRAPESTRDQAQRKAFAQERSAPSDPAYRTFLNSLQVAIRSGNRTAVTRLIAYPLRVNASGTAQTYRDSASVIRDFDRIFTPRVKQAALNQRFDQLFSRDVGVMIGDGAIWFDHVCRGRDCERTGPVRITAINP
jgi:hypothetical protein